MDIIIGNIFSLIFAILFAISVIYEEKKDLMMKQVLNFIFILFLCLMMLPVRADMLVPVTDFFPPLHILEENASSLIFFAIILSFIFGKRLYQKTHSKWQIFLFVLLVFCSCLPKIVEYGYESDFLRNYFRDRDIVDLDSVLVNDTYSLIYCSSFTLLFLVLWEKTRQLGKYAFITSAINLCMFFLISDRFYYSLPRIFCLCLVVFVIIVGEKLINKIQKKEQV